MLQKNAAWWAALTRSGVEWRWGMDILDTDEATLLEDVTVRDRYAADRLVAGTGEVQVDTTAQSMRTFVCTLRNSDGRYHPGPKGYPSAGAGSPIATGLIWLTCRYRPWIDLRVGTDSQGHPIYDRTSLGIYVLSNPESQTTITGSILQLTLLDKSALLMDPHRITNTNIPTFSKKGHTTGGYAKGSSFNSVMKDLATRGGIPASRISLEPSTQTLNADYPIVEGDEWWPHLQGLAAALSHIIYFDTQGTLVCRSDPTLHATPSLYTFRDGKNAIIKQLNRTSDYTHTFNKVIVLGTNSKSALFRGTATLTDARSPYHSSRIGERVTYYGANGLGDMTPNPTITSNAQCTSRAKTVLARAIGELESFGIEARNIPALEPYDRVTVSVAGGGANTDVIITQGTWRLGGAGMSLQGATWITSA